MRAAGAAVRFLRPASETRVRRVCERACCRGRAQAVARATPLRIGGTRTHRGLGAVGAVRARSAHVVRTPVAGLARPAVAGGAHAARRRVPASSALSLWRDEPRFVTRVSESWGQCGWGPPDGVAGQREGARRPPRSRVASCSSRSSRNRARPARQTCPTPPRGTVADVRRCSSPRCPVPARTCSTGPCRHWHSGRLRAGRDATGGRGGGTGEADGRAGKDAAGTREAERGTWGGER